MAQRCDLAQAGYSLEDLTAAARATVEEVVSVAGDLCLEDGGPPTSNFLSFVITNGTTMLAHQGGKVLYYSTYKRMCPDRDQCPSFGTACEAPTEQGFVNHLLISSEPLQGDNVWQAMKPFEVVGVDWRMQIQHDR